MEYSGITSVLDWIDDILLSTKNHQTFVHFSNSLPLAKNPKFLKKNNLPNYCSYYTFKHENQ